MQSGSPAHETAGLGKDLFHNLWMFFEQGAEIVDLAPMKVLSDEMACEFFIQKEHFLKEVQFFCFWCAFSFFERGDLLMFPEKEGECVQFLKGAVGFVHVV